MYKRRFRVLKFIKELFKEDASEYGSWMTLAMWAGPATMCVGGTWLMVMAITDMIMRLV